MLKKFLLAVSLFTFPLYIQQCYAIDATSSNELGGPTAQVLALILVDGIDVVLGVSPATITGDQRAIGLFTGGVTPIGTLLPQPNQNAEGDAVYSGGIGIESGVCLCTGLINDDEVNSPIGRGVGIQGPNNGDPITAMEMAILIVMISRTGRKSTLPRSNF